MSELRIISTTLQCLRFLQSFKNVKNYSQLFGTPVRNLPGSAS